MAVPITTVTLTLASILHWSVFCHSNPLIKVTFITTLIMRGADRGGVSLGGISFLAGASNDVNHCNNRRFVEAFSRRDSDSPQDHFGLSEV